MMIRQSPFAGSCKYLHNYDKKICTFFEKERKKKKQRQKYENLVPKGNRKMLFCFSKSTARLLLILLKLS